MSSLQEASSLNSNNKLPRELLRWIQSLDLAYSVKNVKRDFANGFLVAEILSRYFDREISMHSYDNGTSSKVKKDNWFLLVKFFSKVPGLDDLINQAQVDAIIHAENGIAVEFLSRLYTKLTRRELQITQPRELDTDIPQFAKPTGATIIRETMQGAEISEIKDDIRRENILKTVHDTHERGLQQERNIDREHYSPTSKSSTKILRGTSTQVVVTKPSSNSKSVEIKEVLVKTLNDQDLAAFRAAREKKDVNNNSLISKEISSLNSSSTTNAFSIDNVSKRSVFNLLDDYIQRYLMDMKKNEVIKQFNTNDKGYFQSFIDIICEGTSMGILSDEQIGQLFINLCDETNGLSMISMDKVKDFYHLMTCFMKILFTKHEDNIIFSSVLEFICHFGERCVEVDASSCGNLFMDYGLEKTCKMIQIFPSKRHSALRIIYSFIPSNIPSHLEMIKKLRENIPDIPSFIHALSILVFMERQMDETLFDLYHYYCTIGLNTSSPILRSACIAMYTAFLEFDARLAMEQLQHLIPYLQKDSWWEIKIQLLIVACNILDKINPKEEVDENFLQQALQIIRYEFHIHASINVRKIGLSYLAKLLHVYHDLVPLYIDVLYSIPSDVRQNLMLSKQDHEMEQLPLNGSSGAKYPLQALSLSWDHAAITRQLYFDKCCTFGESQETDYDVIQIISVCCQGMASKQKEALDMFYKDYQLYLYQALVIPEQSGFAADSLAIISYYSTIDINILDHPKIIKIGTQLISKKTNQICQENFIQLLKEIQSTSKAYEKNVSNYLHQVAKEVGTLFESSPFASLLQDTNS